MDDQRELYPRNFRFPDPSNRTGEGYNPLCGDKITLKLRVDDDGRIDDLGFQGQGCAISTASASTMTEVLKGKTLDEAKALFQQFHALVMKESGDAPDLDALGKLAVFAGVAEFPMRVKCATLPWHTLQSALAQTQQPATTE